MDLRVLRYFLTVAREGSITRAAERLFLTQPTLSKQLQDLESELGCRLFDRGGRRITLTEEGLLLRRRAEELLALAERTRLELSKTEDTLSGTVSIGGGETEAMRFIGRAAHALLKRHPQLRLHLHSGNAEDIKARLEQGTLDFGLFIEPTELNRYDVLRLPAWDSWGLLVRTDHPLASHAAVTPKDLAGLPLLCSRQQLVGNDLSGWLGADAENLRIVATYNLLHNASLMVEEGVGCALCLARLVDTSGARPLRFLPLSPALRVGIVLAWPKGHTHTRPAMAFLDELKRLLAGENASSGDHQRNRNV